MVQIGFSTDLFYINESNETVDIEIFKHGEADNGLVFQVNLTTTTIGTFYTMHITLRTVYIHVHVCNQRHDIYLNH